MDILLTFLVGAVVIAILMHLHFKHAPDARTALVSPPVFAVAGALIGISVGMIWFLDGERRIYIENGVKHAVFGAIVGGLAGAGAKELFAQLVRARIVVVVFTLMLLGASIGAPIGWLYGTEGFYEDAQDAERLTRRGTLWGSAIGCFVGFAVGLFDACSGRRLPKSEAVAPKAENAVS